jgi:hypothetical protein
VIEESREQYQSLLSKLPYIGGEENQLTSSLIGSAQCLALYCVLKVHGCSAAETGKVLYDAILDSQPNISTPIHPATII